MSGRVREAARAAEAATVGNSASCRSDLEMKGVRKRREENEEAGDYSDQIGN